MRWSTGPKEVVGQVAGRTCVLIDDMIDTAGTIAGAVKVLKAAGAKDVIIAATHAVFSDPGLVTEPSSKTSWMARASRGAIERTSRPSKRCSGGTGRVSVSLPHGSEGVVLCRTRKAGQDE
jgi:hypothetical protein